MPGKYLRQIEDDKPRDPTMSYMVDPAVVKVGDYLRDEYDYHQVLAIREQMFGRPGIRFAELTENEMPPAGAIIHDLRTESPMPTHEELQAMRAAWRLRH